MNTIQTMPAERDRIPYDETLILLEQFRSYATTNVALSTAKNVNNAIDKLLNHLNQNKCELSRDTLIEFRDWLANHSGLAQSTAHEMFGKAKSFIVWLFDNGHIHREIHRRLTIKSNLRPKKIPPIPFNKYHDALANSSWMLGYLFALAYYTGLSLCDCCGLKWENVDMEEGIIRLRRRKTKIETFAPITSGTVLVDYLNELRRRYDEDPPVEFPLDPTGTVNTYVMTDAAMVYNTGRSLDHRLNIALRDAGLPKITWHDIRRSYVSRLVKSGVNHVMIAKAVGHANIDQLMQYTTIDNDQIRSLSQHIANEAPSKVPSWAS